MSTPIKTMFVLTGALAGLTTNLGSRPYPFVKGRLEIVDTPENTALHARFLERNWQAFPEGHPKLQEVQDGQRDVQEEPATGVEVQGNVQPEGEGTEAGGEADDSEGAAEGEAGEAGSVPDGDGHAPELNQKLRKAVLALDPAEDSHWTQDGKPAMVEVEKRYGATDITRSDVEAAAPGFNRKKAREAN